MPEGYTISEPEFIYVPTSMFVQPPHACDVRDCHNGFTAITTKSGDTLWRPASVLKHGFIGKLQSFKRDSFYQNNNDVTMATYKVSGYPFPVVLWFDNATNKRIA